MWLWLARAPTSSPALPTETSAPYTPVDAGTYSLDVNVNASGATVLTIPGLKLEARTVYTAVAVGLAGNGTLKVIPLVDAAAPGAPSAPATGDTLDCLRRPGYVRSSCSSARRW